MPQVFIEEVDQFVQIRRELRLVVVDFSRVCVD